MRTLIFIFAIILVGCDERSLPDQCLRHQLFQECMKEVPAGPQSTKYNDWDEVISECGSQAYYQSLRSTKNIPEQCRL